MDEVAHADGDAYQDLRRDEASSGEQAQGHSLGLWPFATRGTQEVQSAPVLVHRQGCQSDGRVLPAARKRAVVQV